MNFYSFLRPLLFQLPPEVAHRAAIRALQLPTLPRAHAAHDAVEVAGLRFANRIGLAAGFDKNAECYAGALRAGFGFVEIGTVTPRPQLGNPTPRMFRLVNEQAVINRLGFNNEGVDAAVARLKKRNPAQGIVGGNIGKNKDSDDAVADYVTCLHALYKWVDYITVNISSPNTPGLRNLQAADSLRQLLDALFEARHAQQAGGLPRKPIFVKIAPDNDDAALDAIADVAREMQLDGLIISNTTITRDGVAHHVHGNEAGGLSGKPLMALSTEVLKKMHVRTEGNIPLIGVGGIASAADVKAKLDAGASLVQLYTALVYQGPALVQRLIKEMRGDF